MPLGIDPTVDYAFKKLFGDPDNSDLLIHLLNAVLTPTSPIVEVEILNPFNDKEFADGKQSVVDVKARDDQENWYNIEMQSKALGVMRKRLPYYNAHLYVNQLSEGEGYELLAPAITVCFLNDVMFRGVKSPHLSFTLCDCQNQVRFSDSLQIHTIELSKYNFDEKSIGTADPLMQWSFFLSRAASFEPSELKRMLPDRAYAKATGIMEKIALTPQQRASYESRLKAERDYKSFMTAERQEGRQEGIEEGLKLGLAQQLQLLQELLRLPVTAESELLTQGLESLQRLCDELKARMLSS